MRPLGLGFIGAGEVAARHLAALKTLAAVRAVAVYDRDPSRGNRGTAAEVLEDPEVDVVVLTVPHALHEELAVRAAGAGKHVLVEKPMAVTAAACTRMIAAAEAAGVLLWVGQQQRQFAHVRAAREILASGELGAALQYTEVRSNHYGPDRPAWFFDPDLAGGGIAMLVGIHTIDRAAWVLQATPAAIAATTETPPGLRIETAARGELFLGELTCRFDWYSDEAFRHETRIDCERGSLQLDAVSLTVRDRHGTERRVVEFDADREYTMSFERQYRALVNTLRDGAPPEITPDEGRAAVATVEALYASARAGGVRIAIDPLANSARSDVPTP